MQPNAARSVPTTSYKKQLSIINYQLKLMKDKELWSKLLHIAITILTAIATTFGVTSCI
jgi:hypothetical protein